MTIQIGVCAIRDPKTGAFLNAEPIFAEQTEENERARDAMMRDAGKLFASWMGEA